MPGSDRGQATLTSWKERERNVCGGLLAWPLLTSSCPCPVLVLPFSQEQSQSLSAYRLPLVTVHHCVLTSFSTSLGFSDLIWCPCLLGLS